MTTNLHETFRAYVTAVGKADRAYVGYTHGEVSEAEVHRLQRAQMEAADAHIAAMNLVHAAVTA